jgi:hypothetical protein
MATPPSLHLILHSSHFFRSGLYLILHFLFQILLRLNVGFPSPHVQAPATAVLRLPLPPQSLMHGGVPATVCPEPVFRQPRKVRSLQNHRPYRKPGGTAYRPEAARILGTGRPEPYRAQHSLAEPYKVPAMEWSSADDPGF